MLTESERGYIAAFIDGEGCINISRRMPAKGVNYSYRAEVIITQASRDVLEWLRARIGGSIHAVRHCWQLRLATQSTADLAGWIDGYSVCKRDQWALMRAFLATFESVGGDKFEAREKLRQQLTHLHGGRGRRVKK